MRGTWAQTQTSFSLGHHPRSSGLPHESHRCIQWLDQECMLIKAGAKFPIWPGFNHNTSFLFFLHLHNLEQRTLHCAFWTQKSCITYFHCWSLCVVTVDSVMFSWHLIFWGWWDMGAPPLVGFLDSVLWSLCIKREFLSSMPGCGSHPLILCSYRGKIN